MTDSVENQLIADSCAIWFLTNNATGVAALLGESYSLLQKPGQAARRTQARVPSQGAYNSTRFIPVNKRYALVADLLVRSSTFCIAFCIANRYPLTAYSDVS
jgi:hypothetical protein